MMTLLTCHIGAVISMKCIRPIVVDIAPAGIAATYVAWVPNMQCFSSDGDEEGVCELVNTYTLIGTWIIPVLRE